MDDRPSRHHQRGQPSLNVITTSFPARPISTSPSTHSQSQSPFRYVRFHHPPPANEKQAAAWANETPLADLTFSTNRPSASSGHHHSPLSSRPPLPVPSPSPTLTGRTSLATWSRPASTSRYKRPRGLRIWTLLRPWIPIILYALTSLGFVVAIACFRTEVFTALDHLSSWLRSDEQFGHAILFLLIFITTIPPVPLYSTLITLSGYTFGPWTGAIISYFAALSGALAVFLLSRALLRDTISRWLASTHAIKRAVRAIEKRPKLLFLIRLAPYPYNVMNCLLAAAPSLTLRTYTLCTALSLFKVIVHTSLGASIHSFREYHAGSDSGMTRTWTAVGVGLCIVVFVYLFTVARRAVDDELSDEENDEEERVSLMVEHVI